MAWATLIAGLIDLFGPFLKEWAKKCAEERAARAAAGLPAPASYASAAAASDDLFDEMIAALPRWARVRRASLRWAKRAATDGAQIRTSLEAHELAIGRDLCAAALEE